jgi:dipeptidyl aminopeptidase/acylaminoacyl peptidase
MLRATLTSLLVAAAAYGAPAAQRPMTFMDVMAMRSVGAGTLSPDGARVAYTVAIPDWKAGKNFTDLFVARADGGAPRRLTFTTDKNETSPQWSRDGQQVAFLSDREGSQQIYLMAVDGGEARKLTTEKDGVHAFAFTRDGRWLVFSAGKPEARQLSLIDLQSETLAPVALPRHDTPVRDFTLDPGSNRVFFTAPEDAEKDDAKRKEKKFDVRLVDQAHATTQLWSLDLAERKEKRWTQAAAFSVSHPVVAQDGAHLAYLAVSSARYANDVSQDETSLQVLDLTTGATRTVLPRLATAGSYRFSPDGKWLAYSAEDGLEQLRNNKLYVAATAGGEPRKLLADWDHSAGARLSWREDSQALFFTENLGVNGALFSVALKDGALTQLTSGTGVVAGTYDWEARRFLFTFSSPARPADYHTATLATLGDPARWVRVSDGNPQTAGLRLGAYETVTWKGRDGVAVEGILVKPLDYVPGKRYPLIVQLHGGPAAADLNSFSGRYITYTHVFAAGGYAVLQPNYRGSDGYGETFRRQIAGNFLQLSFEDIMAGVDHLVRQGLADPDRLGLMGWSAGGHLSNWALTHTSRFKAISSGAGTSNWISMFAQSDTQNVREYYLGGRPYDNPQHFMKESPLSYIKHAKTPMLLHVGEADARVPKPQSDELHMALKKHGVPVEYLVYPGQPHGLQEPRYQLVKMVAEYNWFEKWIKGQPQWFDWKALLATLPEEEKK